MKTENKLNRIFGLFLVLTTALSMNVSAMPGDVNGDGTVTMSDANVVVNYYLATTKPSDFNMTAGDVNNDHHVGCQPDCKHVSYWQYWFFCQRPRIR